MSKKKLIPFVTIFLSFLVILVPMISLLAADDSLSGRLKGFATQSGYDEGTTETTLARTLGKIVNALLGFLGVLFIILIIYAGFTWMTAGGDEEKVKKAKGLLKNSVIGLAIVLGSYFIFFFIYEAIGESTLTGFSPKGIQGP